MSATQPPLPPGWSGPGSSTPAPIPITAPSSRGAVVVSVVAQITFLLALGASGAIAWIKNDYTLLTALAGAAATNATTVVSYWVGSSAGSDKKTSLLAGPPTK